MQPTPIFISQLGLQHIQKQKNSKRVGYKILKFCLYYNRMTRYLTRRAFCVTNTVFVSIKQTTVSALSTVLSSEITLYVRKCIIINYKLWVIHLHDDYFYIPFCSLILQKLTLHSKIAQKSLNYKCFLKVLVPKLRQQDCLDKLVVQVTNTEPAVLGRIFLNVAILGHLPVWYSFEQQQ